TMFTRPMDQFWEACGITPPLQLAVRRRGDRRFAIHRFRQPFLVLGRDRQSDLILDHELVSRRHAYLQVVAGRVYCVDLQSRTGLHWKTGRQQAGWLEDNSVLRVGPYFLRPVPPSPAEESANGDLDFADLPPLPSVQLDFALDGSHKGTWNMRGLVILV